MNIKDIKNIFIKKTSGTAKLKSVLRLKHGAYNSALVAIVLVAAVVINVLATAAVSRFPLEIDLSTTGQNTISDNNLDYIKKIDKEVNVVLCATEEGYVGGYMESYANSMYLAQDATGNYYKQTLNLLKLYEKHNKKINLTFADPDANSFSEIQKIAGDTSLKYGDILVYSTFKVNGEEITNFKVLGYKDIYALYDESGYAEMGYGTYSVTGSKIETALTSALYTVTSEDLKTVAFITSHSKANTYSALASTLKLNSFETVEISTPIIEKIDESVDVLVITAPSTDFSANEISVIEKFLDNGGNKGKSLFVFCDTKSGSMPNLYAFLEEWGTSVREDALLFETNEGNHLTDAPTSMGLSNAGSEFTESVNSNNVLYIADANVALSTAYETMGKRKTEVILQSSETVVAAPLSADATFKPTSEYKKQSFPAAIVTTESIFDEDNNPHESFVTVFSSTDFISQNWTAYDAVGNLSFATALFKNVSGAENTDISFTNKTVVDFAFMQPSESSANLLRIIFIILLPIAIIAAGIVVFFRRKNR